MPTLFCFGFGYTATHYAATCHSRFGRVFGTVRDSTRAAAMNRENNPWRAVLAFSGISMSPYVEVAIADSHHVLVSVPPDATGDAVLAACEPALSKASQLQSVVYLLTIGVYGNHDGAWVDAHSSPHFLYDREDLI